MNILQVLWKNQCRFVDQCNQGFNLKCFYQILLSSRYDVVLNLEVVKANSKSIRFFIYNVAHGTIFSRFFLLFRFVKLLFSCVPFKVYLKVNIFVMCARLMQKCPLKIWKITALYSYEKHSGHICTINIIIKGQVPWDKILTRKMHLVVWSNFCSKIVIRVWFF